MSRIQLILNKLFKVEPGESVTFSLLAMSIFLVIGGNYVIGRTVSRSLFLSSLPQEYIPYRFIAVTVGVILASSLYARVAARYRTDRLIMGFIALMIVGVLLFRVLLATSLASSLWLLGTLFVFLEIIATLSMVQFWTLASEILNAREAKRLFAPITAMGNLGSILAGAAISVFVSFLGTVNLLFIIAMMLAGYICCIWFLGRIHANTLKFPKTRAKLSKQGQPSLVDNIRELKRAPLLLAMAAIAVLITMTSNIVDYQFDLTLKTTFINNNSGLSAFLGSFYFWAGLAGFTLQIVATGPVMRRFGLVASLMALPLSFALGSGMVLASTAALWAVTLTRSSDAVFRYTIHETAFGLLYVPISRETRSRIKVLIDGILKPTSIGLVGVLFIFVGKLHGISPLPWSFVVFGLVSIWIVLILRMKRLYLETLASSIRRRRFDPTRETIDLNDETTVTVIKNTLLEPDISQVLQALSLIREVPGVNWVPALLPLLDHTSPTIRVETLHVLESFGNQGDGAAIQSRLKDSDVGVQAAAIQAYATLSGNSALDEITPYIRDPEPAVRGAAITAVIRLSPLEEARSATSLLKNMASDLDPEVRVATADAIGVLQKRPFYQLLADLVADEDPRVQTRALLIAGRLQQPELLPHIINRLGDPGMAAVAIQALLDYGEEITNSLEVVFTNPYIELSVRQQIPKILGRIPTSVSARILLNHLGEPDDLTRGRVYKALVRLQANQVLFPIDEAVLENQLFAELRQGYDLTLLRASLNSTAVLLEDALALRQQYSMDRIFYLLGLLYPQTNMAQIHASVFDRDSRRSANTLELLDTILTRPIKDMLLPLLEGPAEYIQQTARQLLGLKPPDAREQVVQLAQGVDLWPAVCAVDNIRQNGWAEYASQVKVALEVDDDLLRETVFHTLSLLLPQEEFQKMLENQGAVEVYPWLQNGVHYPHDPESFHQGALPMPLATIERVLLLRGVELFRNISGEDLALIAQVCQEVSFQMGERIIIQGDYGDCLYVLVAGEVNIEIEGIGEVARRSTREVIGEMAILSYQPRSAHCNALTDVTALKIDQADFWDLLEGKPTLSLGVVKVLSTRLDEAVANIKSLGKGREKLQLS